MDGGTLRSKISLYQEKYADIKTRRNYIQMDRDMIEQFYTNTAKEIEELEIRILNKEKEEQIKEEKHQTEVKVYLQKVKNLEYEQEKNNTNILKNGESAKNDEKGHFKHRLKDMHGVKSDLKVNFNENEKSNIQDVEKNQEYYNKYYNNEEKKFDEKIQQLINNYEVKLHELKEDLDLKLKVFLNFYISSLKFFEKN